MEGLNNGIESKKTNQEIVLEIKKEYPKFKIFWNAILEQVKENKGSIYVGDNPSPLYVTRYLASKLQGMKIEMQHYESSLRENSQAEMPVHLHKAFMSLLQQTLGTASDVYYGETDILDEKGRIKEILK